MPLEQGAVELEVVEGGAQPAVGHEHHVGAHQRRHLRVGHIDDRADADVARALEEHRVRDGVHARERLPDGGGLRLRRDLAVDEPLGVVAWDQHGAHVRVVEVVQPKVPRCEPVRACVHCVLHALPVALGGCAAACVVASPRTP